MSHTQQLAFIGRTKAHFPEHFSGVDVLEVGSLNINGTVRVFFDAKMYIGVDLIPGKDVDLVCAGNELDHPEGLYDTVISTECFEHDRHWKETFANMVRMARPGGLVVFTCASEGRHEHGTTRTSPADSPATNDYYRNLSRADFEAAFDLGKMFSKHYFEYNPETCDLYFWGFKKTE